MLIILLVLVVADTVVSILHYRDVMRLTDAVLSRLDALEAQMDDLSTLALATTPPEQKSPSLAPWPT